MPSVMEPTVPTPVRNETTVRPVLIAGEWRAARNVETFRATDPRTGHETGDIYPVSAWPDLDTALASAAAAATVLRTMSDVGMRVATFLESYAGNIEQAADSIVSAASEETGLPAPTRLRSVELPRTVGQLRQAATAARDGTWQRPMIDTKAGLRSCLAPIGPVLVIGPNNFPLAFNGISGGDFAAAIAAGNPVIAKAHPLHPNTSRLLAEQARSAAAAAGLPGGSVQMIYHMVPHDGLRMVRDPRLAAVAFTGGRPVGLKLKAAADAAGKLFFGEMSSLNPLVLLPGALAERAEAIIEQFVVSVMMGTGQFCTKPGLILLNAGTSADQFIAAVTTKFAAAPAGLLFSAVGQASLEVAIRTLVAAGADLLTGGCPTGNGFSIENALLRVSAKQFLENPHAFQTEAFGNAAMFVVADGPDQMLAVIEAFEGNLTGSIYSSTDGSDDSTYDAVAERLRPKVGRLINDKMPTGVAVSSAQHHGGPYPASSQPHFTAVGLPAGMLRFTQLQAYDNVRDDRLPPCLRDASPTPDLWRQIDGRWSQAGL